MASSAPNQYATELITVMTVVATVAVEKAAVMALAMEVEATVVVVTEVEATMAVEEVVMMAVMAAMVESTVMVAVAAMASAEMGVEKAAMAAAVRGVEKALGRSVLEVRSRRRSCCFRQNRFDALCWCDYKVHELPHQIREGVSQTQCAARLTTSRQPRRRLEREEGRRPPCHQQPRVPA
jgi:hypothetical protein